MAPYQVPLVLAVLMVATPGLSLAQDQTAVLREGCGTCTLEWHRVAVLGDERQALLGAPGALTRDSHGRYFAVSEALLQQVLVFDSTGRFLRTIGRKGRGPGEYGKAAYVVVGPGDTLLVVDNFLQRITRLTPDLDVAGIVPLPGSFNWDIIPLQDGAGIMNLYVGTPERVGLPLHVVDPSGAIRLSFGAEAPEPVRRDLISTTWRKLALSPDGNIWSARINQYRLTLWDLYGHRLRALTRDVEWFKSWITLENFAPNRPPHTWIRAIHQDAAGLLWVLASVPDTNWNAALDVQTTPEGRFYVPSDHNKFFDTIVEVIEPGSGLVLVSQRLPMFLQEFVSDDLAYSYRESSVPGPRFDVWQLTLYRPKTGGARPTWRRFPPRPRR